MGVLSFLGKVKEKIRKVTGSEVAEDPKAPPDFSKLVPVAPMPADIPTQGFQAPPPKQVEIPIMQKPGEQIGDPSIGGTTITANQPGVKSGWIRTPQGWVPAGSTAGAPPAWNVPIAPQFQKILNESGAQRQARFQAALEFIKTQPTEQEAASGFPLNPLELGTAAAKIGGGAAVGFGLGSIAPGVGNVVGAAGGASTGALWTIATIGANKVQNVKLADTNRRLATNNIKAIINLAEAGDITAPEAAIMLRREEITLRQVQATLKKETKTAIGADLSKGLDDLAKINNYFDFDAINYKRELINGLANPTGKVIALESLDDLESTS